MKSTCALAALIVFASVCTVTHAWSQAAARTDVYHVHFAKAALGKGAQEGDFLKMQDPKAPMKGHMLVLRHQEGADWDYAVIEHLGTKATIEAAGNPPPAGMRDLNSWHGDTFVNGPAWPEFAKAMGIDETAKNTDKSLYVVTTATAAPGHRDQLEKALAQAPDPGDTLAGAVLMQHLEGAPWNFVRIQRYNSWQDFAASEQKNVPDTLKAGGGWLELRDHSSSHTDTLADRIAP